MEDLATLQVLAEVQLQEDLAAVVGMHNLVQQELLDRAMREAMVHYPHRTVVVVAGLVRLAHLLLLDRVVVLGFCHLFLGRQLITLAAVLAQPTILTQVYLVGLAAVA